MSDSPIFRHTLLFSAICLSSSAAVFAQEQEPDSSAWQGTPLEEVMVTSQFIESYRGGVPLEDTPQAVQVMSEELLDDIGITDFDDALSLSGSIAKQNNFGGLWDSFAIRGFAGDENLPSGYLINGFSGGRGFSGVRDAANIERIEVLKGPGSALYGRSEPGGTINIVTKKPQFEEYGYVQVSAGTYDTYRLEADYTNALTDELAFRINGAYNDAGSFRDTLSSEKYTVTPSLVWTPTDAATFTYELELLNQESYFDRGIVVEVDGEPTGLPPERFLGEPNDGPNSIEATGHQLMSEYEFDNGWAIVGALGYRESSFSGYGTTAEGAASRQLLFTDDSTLNRQRRYRDYDATDLSGRVELSGAFDTGFLTHNILTGVDMYDYELSYRQERWRIGWNSGDDTYAIDIYEPEYGQPQPDTLPADDRLEQQLAYGVYIQDQIDLSASLRVMLGVRFDDFDQEIYYRDSDTNNEQTQTEVNPRFGVVYDFSNMSSIYASYSEGFRPNSGSDWQNQAFDPENSKSYEVGAKLGTADGRITSTIALFKAEKSNILTQDPANPAYSAALGEAESQGVELDVSGELTDDLTLWFSYAYVDAATTNEMINPDWGVNVPAGTQLVNIPKHSANVTLAQRLTVMNKPASVGVSANYVDERPGETVNPDYWLPSYTLVKLFSSYEATDNLTLKLEVNNLLDEEYYPSSYSAFWTMPGEPRTFTVKARYQM